MFSFQTFHKTNFHKTIRPFSGLLIVMFLIASIGLSVASHYGISWDEEATLGVVDINYQLVTQRGDPQGHRQNHRQYYGTWFNVAAEAVFKGQQLIDPGIAQGACAAANSNACLLAKLQSKHIFTFLVSLITYGAVAGIVAMFTGWALSWVGPLVLLLMPRFWGNSFFNPKDIPLAAMFTLGTLLGAYLVRDYASTDRRQSLGKNAATGYSVLYGILVGFVAGARIDSSVLILYVILVDIGLQLAQGRSILQVLRFCQFYGLMLLTTALTIWMLYPGSWANPVQWYFSAFNFYYKEDWPHTVLFQGVDIPANALPWNYIPTWIGITTPVVVLSLFGLGLGLAAMRYGQMQTGQKACLWLVGLQIFGLPLFAIAYQATLFDTLRQVLYMLPGISAIAALAIIWLYQILQSNLSRLALVSALVVLALPIAVDMIELHPYEYVYFNRAFGGLPAAAGRFETDYWGVSMADSVRWINAASNPALPLVSSKPLISAELWVEGDRPVVNYDDFEEALEVDKESLATFYYLSLPRWGWEQRLADCPVVYGTTRQQVRLSRVKKCG